MSHTFEFEPARVLGVAPGASMEAIRESYRALAKKFHPDHGGEEWAFRLVTRSYELMSRSRLAERIAEEDRSASAKARARSDRPEPVTPAAPANDGETVRAGVRDEVDHPGKLVDAELLLLRLELDDPYAVLTIPQERRNLSCTLTVTWPSAVARGEGGPVAGPSPAAAEVLPIVAACFDEAAGRVPPTSRLDDPGDGYFRGLLVYPTARQASEAFIALRQSLKRRGLGARQWSREILVPKADG